MTNLTVQSRIFFFVFDQKERDYNFCVIDFIIILKQFSGETLLVLVGGKEVKTMR